MISEICATDTPTRAGAICDRIRRTPGWCQAASSRAIVTPKRGSMPMRASAGPWIASCNTPPIITPMASARIGSTPRARNTGTSHSAAPITLRFNSTGVKAGTAKRFQVLSTPEASATIDMNPM